MLAVRRLPWAAGALVACAKVAGEVLGNTYNGVRAAAETTRRIVHCKREASGRSARAAQPSRRACFAMR
jgi:hypothetical protein